jgi:predicted transcriptional regulator
MEPNDYAAAQKELLRYTKAELAGMVFFCRETIRHHDAEKKRLNEENIGLRKELTQTRMLIPRALQEVVDRYDVLLEKERWYGLEGEEAEEMKKVRDTLRRERPWSRPEDDDLDLRVNAFLETLPKAVPDAD